MRCPSCKSDNDKVVDTRPSEDGMSIRRRRECGECGFRYNTHERIEEFPLRVVKKDGRRQTFAREKLLAGILRSLEKRPVGDERAQAIVNEIERELLVQGGMEVDARGLGMMVMERLRALDEVAYVRFASVYREFQAVDEFAKEIQDIQDLRRPEPDRLPERGELSRPPERETPDRPPERETPDRLPEREGAPRVFPPFPDRPEAGNPAEREQPPSHPPAGDPGCC